MWRRRIQIDQRRQSSRNALSRHGIRLPCCLLQLLYCQSSHFTSFTPSAAVIDSGTRARGFLAKTRSSPRGDLARGVDHDTPERHEIGERGLRPRNNTEDHGNGEGMIGGASGDHGRQEKGKPVVLVLSEAVLVLSEAVIDSGTCARGFLAKTRSSPRGIWRAGVARESRECREWVRVMIFGKWRAGVSHGGAETRR